MSDGLEVLHHGVVTEDQIDHLGHMNVRFYGQHARTGVGALADSCGLLTESEAVVQTDAYTRHHREQLLGARLAVLGGMVGAGEQHVDLYQELVNEETDELAATFLTRIELHDRSTRTPLDLPSGVVESVEGRQVTVPVHGRARSIDLEHDPVGHAPDLDVLRERDLAVRRPRVLSTEDCGPDGFVPGEALPDLVWGGVPMPGRAFQPFQATADGLTLGWASMETRATWGRIPRLGDRVQSFGAEVDLRDKTTRSQHWLFDLERGDLVGCFSVVNLAFDMDARRAVVIPDEVRATFEQRLHRDLDGTTTEP